ncbi:lipocalin-like domain-containing protein [Aestuariibaculum lutulentum]|uniref:Lipocalin-like domain-containing protein n=1 Tax=Aestuariibaculum lutulentum TaxID=2920935 RepID=A0ABS9RJY7_9FLAO|nr:glycoside hydrolase family 43 C-terminal domain-containing protein [Aestuariibaculum lutulentum]MCH4553268.1 hypothetical protein [Aestuariibaculum lutulentum]
MKLLKSIFLVFAIVLFSNCEIKKETKDTTITTSELIGNWRLSEDSETENKIKNVIFKDDFSAEITFNDGSSTKIIQGTWKLDEPKQIEEGDFNLTMKSDVKLNFNESNTNNVTVFLNAEELDNKIILTSHNLTLSKS